MFRSLLTFVVLVLATFACSVPVMLLGLLNRNGNAGMRAARIWSRIMLATIRTRVKYDGLQQMSAHMPCLYISNHQSNADIWALANVLPLPTRWVGKRVLFQVPILGWAMSAAGFISIDRSDRSRAIRSLRRAGERVRAGHPVILFAEGTRSRTGTLQPFKKGAFHLALAAGVPVVPVAIRGSGEVLPPGSMRVKPGTIHVRFLTPIDVTPYLPDRHDALREEVHRVMAAALEPDTAQESISRSG